MLTVLDLVGFKEELIERGERQNLGNTSAPTLAQFVLHRHKANQPSVLHASTLAAKGSPCASSLVQVGLRIRGVQCKSG